MAFIDQFMHEYDMITATLKHRYLDGILFHKNKLDEVYNLLSDEASRKVYLSEILYCELNNYVKGDLSSSYAGLMTSSEWRKHIEEAKAHPAYKEIKAPDGCTILDYCIAATYIIEQYKYKDIVTIDEGDICLDIGACFGDTSVWFINQGASKSYAFEIDKCNIDCLKENALPYDDKILIKEYAISSKCSQLFFIPHKGNTGAGKIYEQLPYGITNDKYYKVETTTLDKFCTENGIAPNFIKMDIEGAELDAIKGGMNIFKKYRPKFSICIYHKWEHRWEIPLYLKNLLPDYDFFIKKSHPYCETVLFGKPKQYEKIQFI